MKYLKKFNESDETTVITITKQDSDDRNQLNELNVNYQTRVDGEDLEIDGSLKSFYTGRSTEYDFEPSNFGSKKSEEYYDNNWEDIEEEIQDELTNFLTNK